MSQQPSNPWEYEAQRRVDQLRADHESAYREYQGYTQRTDVHLDRIDRDFQNLSSLPTEVRQLATAVDRLTARIELVATTAGTTRRNDLQTGIQLAGLFIAAAAAFFAGTHIGVHP